MTYVPGYDYDVFVSYARADEDGDASGKWVTHFVDCLRGALKLRLGGSDELRIFFDAASLGLNQQLEEMLTAASRSAVFLAIASRSYASRDWTRQELAAFVRTPQDTSRLFAAECLPLVEGEVYPAPLQAHHRIAFWRVSPNNSTPLRSRSAAFEQRVHDLAEQMRNRLVTLRKASQPGSRATSSTATSSAKQVAPQQVNYRRVLLAQVTDDLDDERDQLRRYLEQFGVTVLPAGTYPQGGDAFKAAFEKDLSQAGLFVQLLSRQAGRAPPDLGEGYIRFQHQAATARGVEIVQWRRPDLDLEEVTNLQHHELLAAETVVATGLEAFKAEVLRRAAPPPPQRASRSSLVFIDADKDDAEIAKKLQLEFSRHNFSVIISTLEGSAEEVRADIEENIVECDALVFVYGQTTHNWVRGHQMRYHKLTARRAEPPRILALYIGPPATKPEVNFFLPGMREIDCRAGVAVEPLRVLIEELAG